MINKQKAIALFLIFIIIVVAVCALMALLLLPMAIGYLFNVTSMWGAMAIMAIWYSFVFACLIKFGMD